ncbi:hypothetical protein QBC32DRAFT_216050 [Pseudoneurospora amorphoporcata]|uniref:Uncharacterized protein n=1 Tax=Pseudoneurospora amorphoporcata TaxID=241081 RepID=A0AAN6NSC8_9PEZI|nr:hypothetical protein QBC32DRAFT_216050 [Pseudoneurospora amorphoporcata]
MNSLGAFFLRSLSQRQLPNPYLLVSAGRLRATGLSATLPHAIGHWHYVGNTTQWNRPNSTKVSQPNDKKKKPTRKGKKNKEKKKQEEAVRSFNEFIGGRKLKDWKKLCDTIGLEGEFKCIQSCREAIEAVHVNIYDVLEAAATNQAGGKEMPPRFSTPYDLSEYTKREEKIYPKWEITKGEPEAALLKHIDNPHLDELAQRKKEENMRRKKEEEGGGGKEGCKRRRLKESTSYEPAEEGIRRKGGG